MPEQERQSEVTEFADAETADEETVVEAVTTDNPVEETVVETEAVAEDDAEDNETEAVAEDDAEDNETEAVAEDDADDNETEAVYEDDADDNETEAVYEDDADDNETEAVYEEDTAEEESTSYDDDGGEIEGESEMRDMIGYIARVLVDDADAVQVRSGWSDGRLNINLKVADDDKGKVIGRRGRVVHAMQSLLRVAATKSNMRAGIDVE